MAVDDTPVLIRIAGAEPHGGPRRRISATRLANYNVRAR
jgi:hypothetical protein